MKRSGKAGDIKPRLTGLCAAISNRTNDPFRRLSGRRCERNSGFKKSRIDDPALPRSGLFAFLYFTARKVGFDREHIL
jgi:hypothetical protein